MTEAINQTVMLKTMNWAYDKAVNGLPGFGSAEQLAEDYLKGDKPMDKKLIL